MPPRPRKKSPQPRGRPSSSLLSTAAPATVTTLDNGLAIIVREDHSAPVVSAQAWCRTGSIHEAQWLGAGLSHVLEHMLFKGTTRRTGARIDQEIQEAGGYMNAYTSFDRTVYWINAPNTGTTAALDVLCDIMQNAALPPDELAKELDVIRREMDMNQDDPARRASRRLFETAYTRSPYRLTIIGYPDIFNRLKPDDIRAYYQERYAPNNVFYVVVGDVNTAAVISQIRQACTNTPARPLPPPYLPPEPDQTAPRLVVEEAPIELGHFHFSWHIPDLRHPDLPALDVLTAVLGTGRSSRLYEHVRQRLALVHSIDAWTYSPGQPGLLGMSAVVDAANYQKAAEAMLEQLDLLRQKPVPAAELQKAIKQYTAATLATRKTMQGQAQDLGGSWLATDDLNYSERYLDAVRRLRPSDLLRVARHYLTPENSTHYALLPTATAPKSIAQASVTTDIAPSCVTLPSGLRLILKEDHRLPFVDFRLVFRGGVLAESPANNGISWLLSRMLLKGTRRRSAEDIARQIESVGGSVDTYAGNNSFGLQLEVMANDFDLGFDLLFDTALNPAFRQPEIDRERQTQFAGIRAQRDQLLKSAGMIMRQNLFGNQGYGLDILGTEQSALQLSAATLQSTADQLIRPGNAVLAIAGHINPDRVRHQLQQRIKKWRGSDLFQPPALSPPPRGTQTLRVCEDRDKRQAVVVVGFPGASLSSTDRFALELIQEACSDLGSRLFLRIREKLGLAYYVGAQNSTGLTPGYFAFYAGTAPAKAEQVEIELLEEAANLAQNGLAPEELQRAKAKIIGQKKIARQDLGTLAMTMALDELYGLGFNHNVAEDRDIEAVTLEDVRRVAHHYLRAESAVVTILRGRDDAPDEE